MTREDTFAPVGDLQRILIIKLSALGDFILAIGPMQTIRRQWPNAHLTLMTTAPYRGIAEEMGIFDDILIDPRPSLSQPGTVLDLRRQLRDLQCDMVFDLQTSDRSSGYRALFLPDAPLWSGIARGASHPHANPDRDQMHTIERQAEQLRMSGIPETATADLSFFERVDISRFDLPKPYCIVVPGGAPHRPDKRWPADRFGGFCQWLLTRGIAPIVIGTEAERAAVDQILDLAPGARSLVGETSILEIGALARGACLAVGNDTGPMHIMSAAGCPSIVLYSHASDPALCAQRGPHVVIQRVPDLSALPVDPVIDAARVELDPADT